MFSNVVVKSVSSFGAYCVPFRRIFTDYFHKIVTLARFGISSLMMVQVDRNI
jgi:hypothetical protein